MRTETYEAVSEVVQNSPQIADRITAQARVMALIVATVVPVISLVAGYEMQATRLQTATQVFAHVASKAPTGGRASGSASVGAGHLAPADVLAGLASVGGISRARIRDSAQQVVAEREWERSGIAIATAVPFRYGDREAGTIEASISLLPLVVISTLTIPFGILLGWIVFAALRTSPMRALDLALKEIETRKSTQGRLEQSLSLFAATLESTADGIFVADASGRAVVSNQRFLEMWGISKSVQKWLAEHEPLGSLAAQLRDPTGFFLKQQELHRNIDVESSDVLELQDGRTFEWHSLPQRVDGVAVGRVSSFRDISERKRAEVLLVAEKEVLQMVVTGAPLQEALSVLARYVESQARQMFCSILFRESESDETLLCATGPSLPPGVAKTVGNKVPAKYVDTVQLSSSIAEWNVAGDPAWGDYRALMAQWGVQACFGVPILSSEARPLGLIIAHYRDPCDRQAHDVELIHVATKLTGIAIERRRAETRLHVLAHYDTLTDLPNRVLFRDRLARALARAARGNTKVAAMFLDLDRFKTINDTLGHNAGDALLREVSTRLKHCIRTEDTIARLGGDEFTVIVEQISRFEDISVVAHKIIEALVPSFIISGQETFVTTSIGIAVYPSDSDNLEDLLKNADTAMYKAKEAGGNGYQFYAPEMNVTTLGRLKMESGLRRALERNELLVYYQPKVNLKSGAIIGAEALLRWNSPEAGLVSPAEFIPILEETGLIEPVGEWVLHEVCEQNLAWQAAGLPRLNIAVNLSGRQLQRNNLADVVGRILADTGLDPTLLDLEVTESMLMRNPEYAADILMQVRSRGIMSIDIDDFGTGYSSLSYLKRFPIDALKIDKSFVRDLPGNQEDVAIATAIIALAHSLGLKVIAEGVEGEEQLAFLRNQGCDEIQGYIVSPPLPAERFAQLVRNHQDWAWKFFGNGSGASTRSRRAAETKMNVVLGESERVPDMPVLHDIPPGFRPGTLGAFAAGRC